MVYPPAAELQLGCVPSSLLTFVVILDSRLVVVVENSPNRYSYLVFVVE